MREINTDLLTCNIVEYQNLRQEYKKAKEEMENNVPTKERLKKLIKITSELAKIRKRMKDNLPQA